MLFLQAEFPKHVSPTLCTSGVNALDNCDSEAHCLFLRLIEGGLEDVLGVNQCFFDKCLEADWAERNDVVTARRCRARENSIYSDIERSDLSDVAPGRLGPLYIIAIMHGRLEVRVHLGSLTAPLSGIWCITLSISNGWRECREDVVNEGW